MELDKRIKEGKKPLDCFDAENKELMKSFLNKEGYVSNNLENFCLLDGCFKRLLSNVSKNVKDCFKTSINGGDGGGWKYFLPAEWVKEPEKKYRAFTLTEWINQHEIGDVIHYRGKSEGIEAHIMYMGTYHHKNRGTIVLGVASYTLDCLFEEFEIEIDGKWQPFGAIDE